MTVSRNNPKWTYVCCMPCEMISDLSSLLRGSKSQGSTADANVSLRALKQRPRTGRVATRFDIPVTLDTEPGRILREIYNLWSDLSNRSGRAFQLISILHRSLSILHRPPSGTAYLLVLSCSLEMKQRAHCLLQICWDESRWTSHNIACFLQLVHPARTASTRCVFLNRSENGCLCKWGLP